MRRFEQAKKLVDPGAPPKFKEWRRTNDALMVPDPGFVRQLRILDPKAFVQWDWGSQRWEIWRKPKGKEPILLMRVQAADKSYRELGADILLKLQAGDPRRFTLKQLVDYFNAIDDRIAEEKRKKLEASIRARSLEAAWYMKGLRVQVPRGGTVLKGSNTQAIGRVVHG